MFFGRAGCDKSIQKLKILVCFISTTCKMQRAPTGPRWHRSSGAARSSAVGRCSPQDHRRHRLSGAVEVPRCLDDWMGCRMLYEMHEEGKSKEFRVL